jgi:hypothetical protein
MSVYSRSRSSSGSSSDERGSSALVADPDDGSSSSSFDDDDEEASSSSRSSSSSSNESLSTDSSGSEASDPDVASRARQTPRLFVWAEPVDEMATHVSVPRDARVGGQYGTLFGVRHSLHGHTLVRTTEVEPVLSTLQVPVLVFRGESTAPCSVVEFTLVETPQFEQQPLRADASYASIPATHIPLFHVRVRHSNWYALAKMFDVEVAGESLTPDEKCEVADKLFRFQCTAHMMTWLAFGDASIDGDDVHICITVRNDCECLSSYMGHVQVTYTVDKDIVICRQFVGAGWALLDARSPALPESACSLPPALSVEALHGTWRVQSAYWTQHQRVLRLLMDDGAPTMELHRVYYACNGPEASHIAFGGFRALGGNVVVATTWHRELRRLGNYVFACDLLLPRNNAQLDIERGSCIRKRCAPNALPCRESSEHDNLRWITVWASELSRLQVVTVTVWHD